MYFDAIFIETKKSKRVYAPNLIKMRCISTENCILYGG